MKGLGSSIDWENLFKINLRDRSDATHHHDVVKLMIVRKLLNKHVKELNSIRIYTEIATASGVISDIYFENNKTKESYAYEIQKKITPEWLEEKKDQYKDWEVYGIKTTDWVLVDLNKLSKNIDELNNQLEEFIF